MKTTQLALVLAIASAAICAIVAPSASTADITGTALTAGITTAPALESAATLDPRDDIDISTYARGIDISELPQCYQTCMFTDRWDKFDPINLAPEKFCNRRMIITWQNDYWGPCVKKHCQLIGSDVMEDWYKKTCPSVRRFYVVAVATLVKPFDDA
ncbi:hypothetical protein NKR23_g6424 [Pleurostoma richardsiae]|uniref:Uncharacterized protein n=1 Tax=Pleurostoma richardsiae TaxID=41990 RepID=A0AA38RWR2_9PEZI|nr:hypothetical protein NKR23_g6424 [Pleurostoma richardsiae]